MADNSNESAQIIALMKSVVKGMWENGRIDINKPNLPFNQRRTTH